jgi:hypothetical protein
VIRLVMTLNGERLGEFGIAKPRTTIGRRAHNDIVIDHIGVSGEHAAIVQAPQGLLLQDLQSTNGTYVNEQAIEQHLLQPGDVIGIGRCLGRRQRPCRLAFRRWSPGRRGAGRAVRRGPGARRRGQRP